MSTLPPKPSRRTIKRFVWTNIIAAWTTIWASIVWAPDALQWLAGPVLLLIVGIFGFYTGTGTADMFAAMKARSDQPAGAQWSQPPMDDYRGGVDA